MDQYTLGDDDDQIRLRGTWEQVLRRLKPEVPPAWFDRFLRPLTPVESAEGLIVMAAPGKFVYDWVKQKYIERLQDMWGDELGEPVLLELVAEPRDRNVNVQMAQEAAISAPPPVETPKFRLIERFKFDSFVVGQSNRLAFAGAQAVAKEPGGKYNPLFIYGASGLGKTHLLHAIARELLHRDPRFPLVYVSAQQFAEEFVHALQNNRIEQFRRAQRNVGVWLLDDIQFIAGKDKTQEEVFHTFNYLHSLGKQIVICSDRPPRELHLLDERLRSRFEAGLVADIQLPDTETRCAIVLSKAKQEGIELTTEVAMHLAENVPGNIRILEGALTKVVAQASVDSQELTVDLASRIVDLYYRDRGLMKPGFEQIVEAVSRRYKISIDEIKGQSRKAPIVHARHVAVFITRELTGDSWKHIGSLFGDRDHTSMMHGYQKISEMMVRDRDLRSVIKQLIRDLYPEA